MSKAEIKVGDFELRIEIESGKIGEELSKLLDAIVMAEPAVPEVVAPIKEIPAPKPKQKKIVKEVKKERVIAKKPKGKKVEAKSEELKKPVAKKEPTAIKKTPKSTPVQKKIEQIAKPKAATPEIKEATKPQATPEKKPVLVEPPAKPEAKIETKVKGDFGKYLSNFKESLNEPYTILAFASFSARPFDSIEYYEAIEKMGKMTPKIRKRFQIYTNLLTKLGKIESPSKGTYKITEKGKIDLDKKR